MINKEESSYECATSDLDLFLVPPIQTSLENATLTECQALGNYTQNAPLEFNILGNSDEYMDTSQAYLYLKCRIKKPKNEDLTSTNTVAPSNLFLHSLFSQVDVSLNNQKITSSSNTYPYRAMFETLLNYGEEAKTTHLTTSMFYKDTSGKMDSISVDKIKPENNNDGFVKRKQIAENSKSFELYGRLHSDIFFQNRYIVNNVNLNVKCIRSSNAFCLMGDTLANYEVHIEQALMYVRKVKISPAVLLAHSLALEKAHLKYPLNRVETITHTIPSGSSSITFDNLSTGIIPQRVVFALVESEAANGSYSKNCFNFKHFNLSNVSLTQNQQEVIGSPMVLNFGENSYIRAYSNMFNALDRGGYDWGNNISKEDFKDGYTIFAFDLSPDKCNGDHLNLQRSGNLKLRLTFEKATTTAIHCYIYMQFDNILKISKGRNVIFDYTI